MNEKIQTTTQPVQSFEEFQAWAEAIDPESAARAKQAGALAIEAWDKGIEEAAQEHMQKRPLSDDRVFIHHQSFRNGTAEKSIDWQYSTNLAETAMTVDGVLPSALDGLVDSRYFIKRETSDDITGSGEELFDFDLATDDEGDKRISIHHNTLHWSDNHPTFMIGLRNRDTSPAIMESLGFGLEDGLAIPTPATLAKRARELGVDVKFINSGQVASSEYLAAFAEGKYPIAVGDMEYYLHDTNDDHISTMVLGGELLRTTLAAAAKTGLDDEQTADSVALAIDRYTGFLRRITSGELDDDPEYRAGMEEYVIDIGKSMHIDEQTTRKVLQASMAQQKTLVERHAQVPA